MYLHIVISVVLIIETIDCATSTVQTEGVPAVCSGGENSEVKSEDVLSSCICDKYYLLWPSDKVHSLLSILLNFLLKSES